ncbi:MAG: hypothetical protein O4749_06300 [Trichodesmium sp. St5_bin2_1]|nr:hypothetical protein [Trichodesmium sp. St5_bin2_1]
MIDRLLSYGGYAEKPTLGQLEFDFYLSGLTHGHDTRVRANGICPYIWGFQG